jgi:hypothetical protein
MVEEIKIGSCRRGGGEKERKKDEHDDGTVMDSHVCPNAAVWWFVNCERQYGLGTAFIGAA